MFPCFVEREFQFLMRNWNTASSDFPKAPAEYLGGLSASPEAFPATSAFSAPNKKPQGRVCNICIFPGIKVATRGTLVM
jgi:hypothetical protein